jgi:hypothetical protein
MIAARSPTSVITEPLLTIKIDGFARETVDADEPRHFGIDGVPGERVEQASQVCRDARTERRVRMLESLERWKVAELVTASAKPRGRGLLARNASAVARLRNRNMSDNTFSVDCRRAAAMPAAIPWISCRSSSIDRPFVSRQL